MPAPGLFRRNAAPLVLYWLSPIAGGLLSGSSPPREFFSVFGLTVMCGLYGAGALLVREATRGWRKGYLSLLCLGAAYGILEEGLVCKSFFDPHWPDLGELAVYGRALDTNWVWAVWLALYHTIVSIAVPVLLTEVAFPQRRAETWLSHRWRTFLGVLLFLIALLGYFGLTKYKPPLPHYVLTWLAAIGLIWLARRLPVRLGAPRPFTARRRTTLKLWALGFFWVVLSFVTFAGLTKTGLPAPGAVLLGLAVAALAGLGVHRLSGDLLHWDDRARYALGAGVVSFWVLLAPLQELDPKRHDTPGMSIVGLLAALLLIWQGSRVWRRTPRALTMKEEAEVRAVTG